MLPNFIRRILGPSSFPKFVQPVELDKQKAHLLKRDRSSSARKDKPGAVEPSEPDIVDPVISKPPV